MAFDSGARWQEQRSFHHSGCEEAPPLLLERSVVAPAATLARPPVADV